jgi:hypothetical protein
MIIVIPLMTYFWDRQKQQKIANKSHCYFFHACLSAARPLMHS